MLLRIQTKINESINRKIVAWNIVFSIILSVIFIWGHYVDENDTLHLDDIGMWISIVGMFIPSCIFLFILLGLMKSIRTRSINLTEPKEWCIPIAIVLCWIPIFLASFPGVFSYDCIEEWYMVSTHEITSHHPVFHVLYLGGLTELSRKLFGNGNAGIVVYVLIQIIIYLGVFTKLICYLKRKKVSPLVQWFAVAFYALSPIVSIFSLVTSKDSLFAIFELAFLLNIFELIDIYNTKGRLTFGSSLKTIIVSFFAMVLRKNGVYIVIATLIAVLIYKRKKWADTLVKIVLPLFALYLLYIGPFYSIHNVKAGSVAEMFSVPLQQIARVNKYERDSLSDEDIDYMNHLVEEERWDNYIPSISDPIKNGFNEDFFKENKVEFFKLWLRLGAKHPITYINAFLANTVDSWYPYARIDGFRGLFGTNEATSDFIEYRVDEPGISEPVLPKLHELIKRMSESMTITTHPIWSLFLTPGWYVVFWLLSLWLSIVEAKGQTIPFHIAMGVSLGTILLGPVGLVRYLLVFYFALPLEIGIFKMKNKKAA